MIHQGEKSPKSSTDAGSVREQQLFHRCHKNCSWKHLNFRETLKNGNYTGDTGFIRSYEIMSVAYKYGGTLQKFHGNTFGTKNMARFDEEGEN